MSGHSKAAIQILFVCLFVATSTFTFAQDGSATGKCTFQTLNIPATAGSNPTPLALNDTGAIVGEMSTSTHNIVGFLFSGGRFTHFRFPGSADTFPHDINRFGVIVGSFDTAGGSGQRAFLVHSGGFREVKIPGFPNAPAIATGVNDQGDITGQFNGNGSSLGFLLHQGRLTILSFPGAKGGTFPTSINNQGVIVGFYHVFDDDVDHGFSWKNGAFTNVQFPGSGDTTPRKISNTGDIVGNFADSNLKGRGFSFDKGRYTAIDPPNSLGTDILGVNSSDQIVGVFATSSGNRNFKAGCTQVF